MSIIHSQGFDQEQNSDIIGYNNFENDDLITFQHDSKTINIFYSQLAKYSKHIRDSYLFSDVFNHFPQEIHEFQEEFQLLSESIDYFFQLLQQNYDINEQLNFTYIHCTDLLKISKFLEIRKLTFKINEYIRDQKTNVDFIIQMIQYDLSTQKETNCGIIDISGEVEQFLTSKINECLSNDKFKELPIQIIYRVVSKSSPNSINSNKLFDIIMKSIDKYCVLFQFLDLEKISEDRLDDLCEIYSNSDENTHQCFDYLKCNLNFIREINKRKKKLEESNEEQNSKMNEFKLEIESLQKQLDVSEKINNQLQNQLNDSNESNNKQQSKMNELESKLVSLQKQLDVSEKINNQLQNQIKDSNESNNVQQSKMKEMETKLALLQEQLDEIFLIKGKIMAKVENGLLISAEINLKENNSSLDTSKSKFIFSTSGEKSLGIEAYEKGEPITSLNMKTSSYLCRPGTYFVRCIVFDSNGKSNEIVSNSVTTSGSSATFGYEGKPNKICLYQGKYKLEVWGARGGSSTGKSCNSYNSDYNRLKQSSVQGGLGGYSHGILNLKKNEIVYVYVGGQGRPSDSSEGSRTEGGFPDGGGTQTGHCSDDSPTVPGTGGGSTSIRIGSDTNYARVIVAGGGGGASGCNAYVDPGGFGGGLIGGNCSCNSSIQGKGAGTQTGSTSGTGYGSNGNPGQFGLGAAGKYRNGCDSGGGGGGGWYGGGSGGYGNYNWVSSGGGGSGWTFTGPNLRAWQSGDSANSSKFVLDSSYYLTDEECLGGNEEFAKPGGNGTERGHDDDGYAKITPL